MEEELEKLAYEKGFRQQCESSYYSLETDEFIFLCLLHKWLREETEPRLDMEYLDYSNEYCCSSGIGAALAKEYAAPGIKLGLTGRSQERLEAVAQACREEGAEDRRHDRRAAGDPTEEGPEDA